MARMLELSTHLPSIVLAPGDVLCAEGGRSGSIWVLEQGSLRVQRNGVDVNAITQPGAIIGEIAVLLGTGHSATVMADSECTLRCAIDGHALLRSHPEITTLVATGLAVRLNFVTTYLADLKHQYGDAPGLAMVPDVLARLAGRQGPAAQPGSMRDPDPEY